LGIMEKKKNAFGMCLTFQNALPFAKYKFGWIRSYLDTKLLLVLYVPNQHTHSYQSNRSVGWILGLVPNVILIVSGYVGVVSCRNQTI
jgi:hypothetical protein